MFRPARPVLLRSWSPGSWHRVGCVVPTCQTNVIPSYFGWLNWVKVASAVNGKRKYVDHIRNLFQLEYKIGIKSVHPFIWYFKILCSLRERARAPRLSCSFCFACLQPHGAILTGRPLFNDLNEVITASKLECDQLHEAEISLSTSASQIPRILELAVSLPCVQEPATSPFCKPDKSNPHPPIVCL
jgi:hypothetical protein